MSMNKHILKKIKQANTIWCVEVWKAKESKLDPKIIITSEGHQTSNPEDIKHKNKY